jgi:methionyl-tRNA formyltransferase
MTAQASLVFFGTGPVSLAALEYLSRYFEIEAIITKPDQTGPGGRAMPHPVRDWAKVHEIQLFQPVDKAALTQLVKSEHFRSQVGLVVDYGLILPESVIKAFPLGLINSHFSLLPKLRGADPITFAILQGETQTGVSIMQVVAALDEGPVLAQSRYALPADITVGELTQALSDLSNQLLVETIPKYLAGQLKPWPQDPAAPPTYTKKLSKTDGVIDWTKPAAQLEREVRAYLGWPGSQATLAGASVIITAAHTADATGQPGQPSVTPAKELCVFCGQDALIIDRLKPAGKPEMTTQAYLAGHKL